MKQIIPLILLSIVFAVFTTQANSTTDITQLVVTIPGQNQLFIYENLQKDFSRMAGVRSCETSLMTKTVVVNFDSRKVKPKDIQSILDKWECNPDEFTYRKLPTAHIKS